MKRTNSNNALNFNGLGKGIYKRIEHWNIEKLVKKIVILGVIIGLSSSWVWYHRMYLNPERRFWMAINNSMATPSVTRSITQGGSGNQVILDYRFHFAPQRVIENKVSFTNRNATTDTSVVTEGIVYPVEQYLRYSSFSTNQTDNGQPITLNELMGLWATDKDSGIDPAQSDLNFLSEQVSLVIFGNYPSEFRREVLSEMQSGQVYGNGLNSSTEVDIDGRKVLRYSVQVDLKKYAAILQKAFVRAGFGDFPPLNPDNYREGSTVNAGIAIDKKTGAIVTVDFGGRTENYSNYGVVKNVQRPEANFSIQELQAKVEQTIGGTAL